VKVSASAGPSQPIGRLPVAFSMIPSVSLITLRSSASGSPVRSCEFVSP